MRGKRGAGNDGQARTTVSPVGRSAVGEPLGSRSADRAPDTVHHHLSIDPNQLDDALREMLGMDGSVMAFTLNRDVPGEADNVTFSKGAVDAIGIAMKGWVLSRIFRQYDTTKKMPRHLTITVTVE